MNSKIETSARVLVLDDEPLVRLLVCSGLEQAGAMVSEAETCAEAIDLFRRTAFDVAVLDYRLPDGDGLDVVRQMRLEGQGIPVVLLSGESLEIAEEALQIDGIAAVLPKPPDMELLTKVVADAVGNDTGAEVTHIGRYAYWKVHSDQQQEPESYVAADWLAVDLSDFSEVLRHALLDCLRAPRCGTAILGADARQRAYLENLLTDADYVADAEELAALARRLSTPAERDFLLQSIQKPGAELHA